MLFPPTITKPLTVYPDPESQFFYPRRGIRNEITTIAIAADNLIWIDLETTGLNPAKDHILQIAVVFTNRRGDVRDNGFWLPVKQPDKVLHSVDPWVKDNLGDVLEASRSHAAAVDYSILEQILHCWLDLYRFTNSNSQNGPMLAGNSVWFDRAFIARCLPSFYSRLHYRQVDVTSVETFLQAGHPLNTDSRLRMKKIKAHRAAEDIKESIKQYAQFMSFIGAAPSPERISI